MDFSTDTSNLKIHILGKFYVIQLNPDMPGDDLCAEVMAFAVWEIVGEKIHKRLTDPPTRIEISLRNFHVLFW